MKRTRTIELSELETRLILVALENLLSLLALVVSRDLKRPSLTMTAFTCEIESLFERFKKLE